MTKIAIYNNSYDRLYYTPLLYHDFETNFLCYELNFDNDIQFICIDDKLQIGLEYDNSCPDFVSFDEMCAMIETNIDRVKIEQLVRTMIAHRIAQPNPSRT